MNLLIFLGGDGNETLNYVNQSAVLFDLHQPSQFKAISSSAGNKCEFGLDKDQL